MTATPSPGRYEYSPIVRTLEAPEATTGCETRAEKHIPTRVLRSNDTYAIPVGELVPFTI